MAKIGLVLTGGGARAAYQAGVLRAISEITGSKEIPFQIVTGLSAGAINGLGIATNAADFKDATQKVWELWAGLQTENVFRANALSFIRIGMRWLRDPGLGGILRERRSSYLLDTAPLKDLLSQHFDCPSVRAHIASGLLHGFAVSTTNYFSGSAVTFFDGAPSINSWVRNNRLALRTSIHVDHVMASAAIPAFFPPIRIQGSYYGDGCIRLTTPLSPAIHLGADCILAISVRTFRDPSQVLELNQAVYPEVISPADIFGVILNAVFLDSLDTDLERAERINRIVSTFRKNQTEELSYQLRHIPILAIRPSRDLGTVACEKCPDFPVAFRYMMKGLGVSGDKGVDLLRYLSFEGEYTRSLLELGHKDAVNQREKIVTFFETDFGH